MTNVDCPGSIKEVTLTTELCLELLGIQSAKVARIPHQALQVMQEIRRGDFPFEFREIAVATFGDRRKVVAGSEILYARIGLAEDRRYDHQITLITHLCESDEQYQNLM